MDNKAFKKLQKQWYKKLKASGFKDIEDTESPLEMLNSWDSLYFLSRYSVQTFQAKQRYFELATQFLESHVFNTAREKAIWAEWCAGASVRAIAKRRRTIIYRIRKIILALEELMFGRRDSNTGT